MFWKLFDVFYPIIFTLGCVYSALHFAHDVALAHYQSMPSAIGVGVFYFIMWSGAMYHWFFVKA